MRELLVGLGAACVIGAIVGGSLKVAKVVELPVITTLGRQVLLGLVGVGLVALGLLLREPASPPATSAQGQASEPAVPAFTFPVLPSQQSEETRIVLSVRSGPPGTRLTVSGTGFDPGETVEITFSTETLAETKADERGRFSDEPIQIPQDWPFEGPVDITASGKASLRFDDAQFRVT